MNYQKIVESISLILNNPQHVNNYLSNSGELLTKIGITEADEQQAVNELLIPVASFREMQVKIFKQRTDYEKKLQSLFEIINNPAAAAAFEISPAEYLKGVGIYSLEEQEQIIQLLTPVREFQQIMIRYREARNDYRAKLECLKKLLHDEHEQRLFKANPKTFFSKNAILNAEDQQLISELVSPAEKLKNSLAKDYVDQLEEIKNVNSSYRQGLSKANHQTIRGFNATMIMYQVSFYLGVALIIVAMVFAFVVKSSLFAIVFGSIGTLDLLTFFIAKPPLSLQESRSEQAKLNAAFYSWFLDLYNWNSFYLQYSQKGEIINLETMKAVSDAQIINTEKLMSLISRHITTEAKS